MVLHPDVNPNASKKEIKLFQNAVEAYKAGDIERLKLIRVMIKENEIPTDKDAIHYLSEEKERILKMLDQVQSDISKIKNKYPYLFKKLLEDETKLEAKKIELEALLKEYEHYITTFQVRITTLME